MLAELDSPVPPECVHRWRIAPPVGGMCLGACSICGAERRFTNERFPFGQPGRAKKSVSDLRPVVAPQPLPPLLPSVRSGLTDLSGPAGMSAFLLQHRARLDEAALPE